MVLVRPGLPREGHGSRWFSWNGWGIMGQVFSPFARIPMIAPNAADLPRLRRACLKPGERRPHGTFSIGRATASRRWFETFPGMSVCFRGLRRWAWSVVVEYHVE